MNPEQWAQISELFHRGLPLSNPERDRLLADEVQDPEIEAQLRRLWEHANPTGFLERPLLQTSREEAAESTRTLIDQETELARETVPDRESTGRIGKYRVVSVLGEGGMGVVYLGIQDKPIHRQVAIKVIKSGLNSREVLSRFESERQTLALMDHPHIAQIYEADVGADGRPYFVMEYVQGIPITEYCDRNLLGCRDRLLLFQQVCYAVQHAHQRGVIHRDLKPSNILIAVKDGQPVSKVIDFGVAKAINQRLREEVAFTEFGMLVGTPEYMSPEQAEHSADVDTTSDVYSLGVVLYELLAGALPFDSKALRCAGLGEIQRVIREEEPPRPTRRLSSLGESGADVARKRRSDLPSLLRQLRGDLDWIVMKALEKNRTHRYSSASEFAADIGRNLSDEPVLAGPPSATYQLKKFARRHRLEFAAATILLIVIIAALVSSTFLYFRAERARALAESQAYKATLAAARSSLDAFSAAEARDTLLSIPARLRKWEWKYLYWLSDNSVVTLNSGEGGQDNRVAFSADGTVVFVSTATSVHAWRTGSFLRIGDYGPFGRIVSLSRDGSHVVSETNQGSVRGFEVVETGTRKLVLRRVDRDVPLVDASFDASGKRLVTLARDGRAEVWDLASNRLITSIVPPRAPPARSMGRSHEMVALSPDGAILAKTEYDDIRLYDAVSGRSIAVLHENRGPVQSISFSADGQRLMSATLSGSIWNVKTGELISSSKFQKAFSIAVESPDGGTLALAGWYHAVHFLNQATGELVETVLTPTVATFAALAWSPKGEYLIGADFAGGVHVWNGSKMGGQNLQLLRNKPATNYDFSRPDFGFNGMTLSSDGKRVVVAAESEIRVVDTETGRQLSVLKTAAVAPITALAWQPGTDLLAFGSGEKKITLCTTASATPLRQIEGHEESVTALAFSPDGTALISGSADRTIRFWDVGTGAQRLSRKLAGQIINLSISPDNNAVAVLLNRLSYTSGEAPIQLFNAHTGEPLPPLTKIEEYSTVGGRQELAFSPDGKWIAASEGGTMGAAIWDVQSGKQVRRLASVGKQGYAAIAFAFSPDGQRLAGAFGGGIIAIWNPNNGELLVELFGDTKQLRFSPDGLHLYVNAFTSLENFDTHSAYPPEVEELLRSLQERFPLVCDLRNFLQGNSIDPGLRALALQWSDHHQESPQAVRELVDNVLNSASGSQAAYETALRHARMISETYPWNQAAIVRLGVALYRTKAFADSLATLERATPQEPAVAMRKQVFMSMAYYRVGKTAQGRDFLHAARSVKAVLPPREANTIATLLKEAESIHP